MIIDLFYYIRGKYILEVSEEVAQTGGVNITVSEFNTLNFIVSA